MWELDTDTGPVSFQFSFCEEPDAPPYLRNAMRSRMHEKWVCFQLTRQSRMALHVVEAGCTTCFLMSVKGKEMAIIPFNDASPGDTYGAFPCRGTHPFRTLGHTLSAEGQLGVPQRLSPHLSTDLAPLPFVLVLSVRSACPEVKVESPTHEMLKEMLSRGSQQAMMQGA